MNCTYICLFMIFITSLLPSHAQKDTLILKEQVNRLQEDLDNQKEITAKLLDKTNILIEKQSDLIKQYVQTNIIIQGLQSNQKNKPTEFVTIAILAKDKAHTLPLYLQCIEQQTWPAQQTYLYIRTNNNNILLPNLIS